MGYAGYYSTTAKIKDRRTPLEQALFAVGSLEALELLEKVTYNAAVQPNEDKFRKLKLGNKKIQSTIVEAEGGLAALLALGWQQGEEEGEAVVTLPKGAASMAQVRAVQEAQQEFKKSARQVQRSKSAAALPGSAETELLRQQMEADRRERAQAEPAKASVAQPLPGQGARVATAKDAGINCDCC
ncbi:hypothetical protein ABPG75_001313 [Micractinium tetrahymenae]